MSTPAARQSHRALRRSTRDEGVRQAALAATGLLDTPAEEAFDDLVRLACLVCAAPAGTLTLVDADRQWFKARVGIDATETPRSESVCALAIERPDEMLVVHDLVADPAFPMRPRDSEGELLRFYAGMPLRDWKGHALGALCVLDRVPRTLDDAQRAGLQALARQAERLLELRRLTGRQRELLRQRADRVQKLEDERQAWQRRHHDLKQEASRDPLTGLLSRRALERLRKDRKALRRLEASGYALVVLDIDEFKRINDRHGHLLGDQALRLVAGAIMSCVREGDLAARYGGEEFLLLLPGTSAAAAADVAERIRVAVEALVLPFGLTLSAGVAEAHRDRESPEKVFERADQALYRAKAFGRNRVLAEGASPR